MENKYSLPRSVSLTVSDKEKNKQYRIEFDGGMRYWMVYEKRKNDYHLINVVRSEEELISRYKFLKQYLQGVQFNDELQEVINEN